MFSTALLAIDIWNYRRPAEFFYKNLRAFEILQTREFLNSYRPLPPYSNSVTLKMIKLCSCPHLVENAYKWWLGFHKFGDLAGNIPSVGIMYRPNKKSKKSPKLSKPNQSDPNYTGYPVYSVRSVSIFLQIDWSVWFTILD